MSTRIKRLKRSVYEDGRKEPNSTEISTSSSPSVEVVSSNTDTAKKRRRKVRSTQDFNNFNITADSQNLDDAVTKAKNVKTRKAKLLYDLPNISSVVEDFMHIKHENTPAARIEKKLIEKDDVQIVDKDKKRVQQPTTSRVSEKNSNPARNVSPIELKGKPNIKEDEQFESAHSAVSDDEEDSEIEIIIRSKKKNSLKKQHKKDTGTDKIQVDDIQSKTKRIQMLLSDESVIKISCNDVSDSLVLSSRKLKQNSPNRRFSAKQTDTSTFQTTSLTESNIPLLTNCYSKQSISAEHDATISTPYRKKSCGELSNQLQERRYTRSSKLNFSDNLPEASTHMEQQNKEDSTLIENVNCDTDSVSPYSLRKRSKGKQGIESKQPSSRVSNADVKIRKSVRFQSPSENSRRETLILSKSSMGTKLLPKNIITSTVNSIFEIDPLSKDLVEDVPEEANILEKRNTTFKVSEKPSTSRRESKRKLSKEKESFMKFMDDTGNDISNISDCFVVPTTKNNDFYEQHMPLTPIAPIDEIHSIPESLPKLHRSSTFTISDDSIEVKPEVSAILQNSSPARVDISGIKNIDTSKVTKRKCWNKSRLSFLHNSFSLQNISAPWQNGAEDVSDISDMNFNVKCNQTNSDADINFSFTNLKTPPSSASTPFPKGKTNLLKQAVLHDQRNISCDKSKTCKNQSTEQPVPKFTRKKVPNFALIHQRAYDKLESLKEMSERKAARAQLLLSGYKPPSEGTLKDSTKRKELKFSPTRPKLNNLNNISVTKVRNISPSTSNQKLTNKENQLNSIEKKKNVLKAKSQIPKAKLPVAVIAEKKGFTRFGFKIRSDAAKSAPKEEQVKAVATKTKIMKNSLQDRRNVIQGVRSNRRFELLMSMRFKK